MSNKTWMCVETHGQCMYLTRIKHIHIDYEHNTFAFYLILMSELFFNISRLIAYD